jgi:hypothetical protein
MGSPIKASGVVAGSTPHEYLIVNDKMGSRNPYLLVMNHNGEITDLRKIAGNVEIDDVESISRVGKTIYVSASLSHNEQGKYKQNRCWLFKLEPEENLFRVSAQLNLCEILAQMAINSENRSTSKFLIQAFAHKTIDVESHVVSKGKLYLGFKTPLDDHDNTIIIQIDDLEGLIARKPPKGRIWKRLPLLDQQTGTPAFLSDMCLENNRLLLLGISQHRGRPSSHLWSYDLKRSRLRLVRSFPNLKAEGVSKQMSGGRRVLVSDGDKQERSRLIAIQSGR